MGNDRLARATRTVRGRYDRIAPVYDSMMRAAERGNALRWRSLLWKRVVGKSVLEVGAGTGLNFLYVDAADGLDITAIDLSVGMLDRARERAAAAGLTVTFRQMDVQALEFPDDSFDTVMGSFLFCSVPDPLLGLREVRRVCRPGGRVVLLEHGLSQNRLLAWLMNLASPAVVWVTGAEHINRTVETYVVRSGLELEKITRLGGAGIVKLVEARKAGALPAGAP